MFSLGPEFVRRVYSKNVDVNIYGKEKIEFENINCLISDRKWEKILKSMEN